jgi:hypothetical protein
MIDKLIAETVKTAVHEALQQSERINVVIEPRFYSGAQAQKMLAVSSAKLYADLKTGALRGIQRGKRDWSISSVAMFEYIAMLEGRPGVARLQYIITQ